MHCVLDLNPPSTYMSQFWLGLTKSLFHFLFAAFFWWIEPTKYIYDVILTWAHQVSVLFLVWCIMWWTWTHQVHIWFNSDLDPPSLCFIFCLLHFLMDWTHQVHIWFNSDLDSPSLCAFFGLMHYVLDLGPPSTYMIQFWLGPTKSLFYFLFDALFVELGPTKYIVYHIWLGPTKSLICFPPSSSTEMMTWFHQIWNLFDPPSMCWFLAHGVKMTRNIHQ